MNIDTLLILSKVPSAPFVTSDLFVFQFLGKLYSGQLHREFHYGPEDEEEDKEDSNVIADSTGHIPRLEDKKDRVKRSGPVDSTFQHLKPSDNRYSFRHDEF